MKFSYIKKVSIVSLLIITTFFFSCKSKESSENALSITINNIMYETTLNALNEKKDSFLPSSLVRLLNTPVIENGYIKYTYEKLFNDENCLIYLDSNFSFYDPSSDNALWVDTLLTTIEEERLGQEIEKMENVLNSDEIYVDENEETEEALKAEELIDDIVTNNLVDHNRKLLSSEYDQEIFIPQQNGKNWILIHAFESDVKRFFYDSLYRCYKEEHWEIKRGESEKVIKTIETSFMDETYIPLNKIITEEKSIKKKSYNNKGYLVKEESFVKKEDNKEVITSVMTLKYNSENKVSESDVTEYKYKGDEYKELDYSFNKKYRYKYNKDDIPPNFDYYENGELKISTVYRAKGDYTEKIYFSDGYSVISTYKDNRLQKEVFTLNGVEERIKNYE